jgi:hypothetical protein
VSRTALALISARKKKSFFSFRLFPFSLFVIYMGLTSFFFLSLSHPLGFFGASFFHPHSGICSYLITFFFPPKVTLDSPHCFGIGILHCRISHCFCFFLPFVWFVLFVPYSIFLPSHHRYCSLFSYFTLLLCCVTIRLSLYVIALNNNTTPPWVTATTVDNDATVSSHDTIRLTICVYFLYLGSC